MNAYTHSGIVNNNSDSEILDRPKNISQEKLSLECNPAQQEPRTGFKVGLLFGSLGRCNSKELHLRLRGSSSPQVIVGENAVARKAKLKPQTSL